MNYQEILGLARKAPVTIEPAENGGFAVNIQASSAIELSALAPRSRDMLLAFGTEYKLGQFLEAAYPDYFEPRVAVGLSGSGHKEVTSPVMDDVLQPNEDHADEGFARVDFMTTEEALTAYPRPPEDIKEHP